MADQPTTKEAPAKDAPIVIDPAADALGKRLGNYSLALALLAVDRGEYPKDKDAALDLLDVNKAEEGKAFKRYIKLQQSIGAKLAASHAEYMTLRQRSDRLFQRVTGVSLTRDPDGSDVAARVV